MRKFHTGMWMWSFFGHQGGLRFDDTRNTHQGNKRRNGSWGVLIFRNEWQWEVILLSGIVKFPIVNAHLPPGDSSLRDKLVLFILNDCHPSFLRHYLDRANPFAIWHMIDDPDMQKFEDLLLNNLSHSIVKSPLGFPQWWRIRIDKDTMSAKSGTNPLEVLEWVANGRFMSF